ncbi:pantetheine-phosphate adenylyltransferase [Mycoplasma sp. 394]
MPKQSIKINSALYAGSFNPIHKGHLDIIRKAADLFDHIYVVVSQNPDKPSNDFKTNTAILKEKTKFLDNVKVLENQNMLTAEFAKKLNVKYLVRSARNQTDYAYEIDLASGNKLLNSQLETILIIPDEDYLQYSSALERAKNV